MGLRESDVTTFLKENLDRDVILAVIDAIEASARSSYLQCENADAGHRNAKAGQWRYFDLNERLHQLFNSHDMTSSPELKTGHIFIGKSKKITVGCYNSDSNLLSSGKKSSQRRELASLNSSVDKNYHDDLFSRMPENINELSVFFAYSVNRKYSGKESEPILNSVTILIPDTMFSSFIYKSSAISLLKLYDKDIVQDANERNEEVLVKTKKHQNSLKSHEQES